MDLMQAHDDDLNRKVILLSIGSAAVAALLVALIRRKDEETAATHVEDVVAVPQAMPLDAELPTDIDRGERALRHAENAARRVLPSRNTAIVTELLQARAVGPAIVDEAIERDAGAIVMTAAIHRRHGRPTLGETTEHVLLNAPCDVVVVRAATDAPATAGLLR